MMMNGKSTTESESGLEKMAIGLLSVTTAHWHEQKEAKESKFLAYMLYLGTPLRTMVRSRSIQCLF